VLWALLVLPWAAELILIRRHHHLDVGTVGVLIAVSLGLPTLWVAWAAYRGPPRSATAGSGLGMAQVADQLAAAVGAQWSSEAVIRRLNDPYPLPVSWTSADASLCDAWDSLVKLATSGAGWPPPPAAGAWAADPDALAGEDTDLVKVLARVPTGRLVVLGEPGAGKTMLMVRLVLDLLARRASGAPVPILVSMASWNPAVQDLQGWLAGRLLTDYPALASPAATGREEPTQAAALLAAGLILPILDGLDEIPEQGRGTAISRINEALRPGEEVVVTCRTEQYRAAVRPEGSGVEVTLRAAAAVQLCPLDADTVRSYLRDDAAGPVTRARWDPVLAVLGTDAPTGQALATPLMVGLARAIYNPRPGELAGPPRDPAELRDPALADRTAVESLLFDAFILAAYRNDSYGRWKARDAERWLVFLACHLERTIGGADLAWWQLQGAVASRAFRTGVGLVVGLVAGLVAGLVFGLAVGLKDGLAAGLKDGLVFGLVLGLVIGSVAGLVFGDVKAPARRMRMSIRSLVTALVLGFAVVLVGRLVFGLAGALGAGLALALTLGLAGAPSDLAEVTSPATALSRDRQAALLLGLVVVLTFGLVLGLALGFVIGLVLGFALGLDLGLGLSMSRMAWPSYMLTKGCLAFRHDLPWSLMSFLSDAHRRGVLRQAGAVYQFRHLELQRRLANRPRKVK
jgi:hypothetical protein